MKIFYFILFIQILNIQIYASDFNLENQVNYKVNLYERQKSLYQQISHLAVSNKSINAYTSLVELQVHTHDYYIAKKHSDSIKDLEVKKYFYYKAVKKTKKIISDKAVEKTEKTISTEDSLIFDALEATLDYAQDLIEN